MVSHAFSLCWLRLLLVAALLATVLVALGALPAAAHETREVDRFTFTVGFDQEPAFSHIPNAVDLTIRESETGEPFVDLTDTLDVDVIFGDEVLTMTLRPRFRVDVFGTPGEYGAHFVPSRPGEYTFRFHGTVDGVDIDEEFVSGPDTFNDVEDISTAMFPAQDPTVGELAERLEREVERLQARLDEEHVDMDAAAATAGGDTAEADWVARGLGIAALLVGVGAGGAALTRRKP